ncbi:DEAD/DEAH box helicase family protein [uncultured Fibrobacter sp.]|uniref:type I restriction endonuclease subunit R n=1 Tax=uncultured Fibrobacter sp. TaxID=261512 RepID=UPI0025D31A48|nr:DEAD/DEAH box helicase family protein [uncultured Fibrobacter sp.]
METSKTNEQAFEALIERALVGSTREEREAANLTDIDAQTPAAEQYYWGRPSDFDKVLAFDMRRLWSFFEATQGDVIAEYKGGDPKTEIPKQVSKYIKNFGVIDALRKGVDVDNIHVTLFYPKPSPSDSAISWEKYAQNQFSVTRQQTFSVSKPGLEIDMVLYVNGVPLFTFELKDPWTHQTARYDGQKQYKEDRDPKETLLNFGRCLAHFTLDKDEVFFTTKLDLNRTIFMPFNKGLPGGLGAGNPVNADGGYKTSYLWGKILRKKIIADIIMNYVLFDYGEAKTQKKVPHIMRNAKKLIFPRYHQLDVVQKLVEDVSEIGVGKTYLIEHSAGSGKSNSLTWLAFKLIKVCPVTMDAIRAKSLTDSLFSSVIVVTDRRILDKQITDNIKAFGQSSNIFAHADSSTDLKESIEAGKRIIITTIQKFPKICNAISDVSDRNFAIIIDEAHSSQSGIAADKMNATVQKDADMDGGDTDALLEKLMRDRKMSTNCSYFAFTATPKKETLERFGTKDSEGKFHPFHLYSMKQAIEEGFILDVLTNYTTYKSYYELIKATDRNPEFNKDKAQKKLRQAVERDSKTIGAKADVMLTHFDAKIFRSRKLKGQAKAMVVTKDIECAIQYYNALNGLIEELNLPFKILIAFSGSKNIGGKEFTEAEMNGFPDSQTAEKFESEDYRILVVANKYLTGFDQPKLCAMYVDKPLDGVLAVQALSRLNRAAPELDKLSEDLFVLDFYNSKDGIKEAFDPFYTATTLSEATDVNILHELRMTLLGFGVFEQKDVDNFIDLYIHGSEADQWAPILDAVANRFNNEIEWPENGKADFKMKCKQFVRIYSKVAAIMAFEVAEWEKLFWFLRYLIPGLHVTSKDDDSVKDLLDSVDLNTYGLRRTALNEKIVLDAGEAIIDPNKPVMVNAGDDKNDPKAALDEILKEFNERWFHGWQATPDDQKTKLVSIAKAVKNNEQYREFVVGNPDPQTSSDKMNEILDSVVRQQRKSDNSLYKSYQQDESFKADFRNLIIRMLDNLDYLQ